MLPGVVPFQIELKIDDPVDFPPVMNPTDPPGNLDDWIESVLKGTTV